MSRRVIAVLSLAVLSPITAEFLLGDQYLPGPPGPQQVGMLVVFVAFYGFGAVGIREIARRAGGGWPAILLLALAFGLVEEGLLTQSLFNPNYLGMHLGEQGAIPGLGLSAPWTVFVLVLHVVWSMGAPIAIAERLFGDGPWLGRTGAWTTAVLYVLGAAATFGTTLLIGSPGAATPFLASPVQVVATLVVVAALAVLAVRRARPPVDPGRGQILGVLIGLLGSSGFQVARQSGGDPWVTTALMLFVAAAAVALIAYLRPGVFGLGVGAVMTYWWVGMITAVQAGVAATVEQSVLVVATGVVLVVAARRPWRAAVVEPSAV